MVKLICCSGWLCITSEIVYIVLFFFQISYCGSMVRFLLVLEKKCMGYEPFLKLVQLPHRKDPEVAFCFG